MNGYVEYASLRRVYRLMALEVTEFIAFILLMAGHSLALLHVPVGTAETRSAITRVYSYLSWSGKAFQLMLWTLMIVSLTRLADVDEDFAKARMWCLTRIIAFAAYTVTVSAFLPEGFGAYPIWEEMRLPYAIILLGLEIFMKIIAAALAAWRIQRADDTLLETIGFAEEADEGRRLGRRALVSACGVAVTGTAFAAMLNIAQNVYSIRIDLYQLTAQGQTALLAAGALLALALTASAILFMADRIRCVRCIRGTYFHLKELSQ